MIYAFAVSLETGACGGVLLHRAGGDGLHITWTASTAGFGRAGRSAGEETEPEADVWTDKIYSKTTVCRLPLKGG